MKIKKQTALELKQQIDRKIQLVLDAAEYIEISNSEINVVTRMQPLCKRIIDGGDQCAGEILVANLRSLAAEIK